MMLSKTAIASLAFGSPGVVPSRVQSQLVHASAFCGKTVPQYGHCIVPGCSSSVCVGASVYSIFEIKVNRAAEFVKQSPMPDWRLSERQQERLPTPERPRLAFCRNFIQL